MLFRSRVEALSPIALTPFEKKAFRMGVLAAGAIYMDAVSLDRACGCKTRLERLRIAIAARGITIEPPEFWPERGGP